MSSYRHRIEYLTSALGDQKWVPRFGEESRAYCDGFVDAYALNRPHLAVRIVRVHDAHVVRIVDAIETASIGQVAGFPTAAQYIDAGVDMLKKAAATLRRDRTLDSATDDRVGLIEEWIESTKYVREGL